MRTFCKRLAEYFAAEVVISVLGTLLLTLIFKNATKILAIKVMLACLIVNALYIGTRLGMQRKYTPKKEYYKVNLAILGVFAVINIILAIINPEPIYTYLFLPYKVFVILGVNKVKSAVMLNIFMLVVISLIPWIIDPYKKDRPKRKKKIRF